MLITLITINKILHYYQASLSSWRMTINFLNGKIFKIFTLIILGISMVIVLASVFYKDIDFDINASILGFICCLMLYFGILRNNIFNK